MYKLYQSKKNSEVHDETVSGLHRKVALKTGLISLNKCSIPTLFDNHKENFTAEGWKLTCLL